MAHNDITGTQWHKHNGIRKNWSFLYVVMSMLLCRYVASVNQALPETQIFFSLALPLTFPLFFSFFRLIKSLLKFVLFWKTFSYSIFLYVFVYLYFNNVYTSSSFFRPTEYQFKGNGHRTRLASIYRFRSIPRNTKDKIHGGHVGSRNKRWSENSIVKCRPTWRQWRHINTSFSYRVHNHYIVSLPSCSVFLHTKRWK